MLSSYLLIGIGFYVGLSAARRRMFKGTTLAGVIRGVLLAVLLWPVGLVIVWKQET